MSQDSISNCLLCLVIMGLCLLLLLVSFQEKKMHQNVTFDEDIQHGFAFSFDRIPCLGLDLVTSIQIFRQGLKF